MIYEILTYLPEILQSPVSIHKALLISSSLAFSKSFISQNVVIDACLQKKNVRGVKNLVVMRCLLNQLNGVVNESYCLAEYSSELCE